MKNKRILLIISCILIAGVLITKYTNSFITSKEAQITAAAGGVMNSQEKAEATVEEAAGQAAVALGRRRSLEAASDPGEQAGTYAAAESGTVAGAADTEAAVDGAAAVKESSDMAAAPEAAQAGPGAMQSGQGTIQGPGAAQEALSGGAAIAEDRSGDQEAAAFAQSAPGPASPIDGVNGKSDQSYLVPANDYRQRLLDLDYQIQKLREEDKDATAYTLKNTAESELKLWESEMGNIYSALLERLSEEQAAELAAEQQEWLKNREARAAEQNSKNNSANLESVGYITSLVTITRDRTYELVGRYEELTSGDSGT